jgi:hypothetical protein
VANMWRDGLLAAGLAGTVSGAVMACAPGGLRLHCIVSGSELLAEPLSSAAICSAFADALAEETGLPVELAGEGAADDGPGAVRLRITVASPYALSASVTERLGGELRSLPEMGLSIADRPLGHRQLDHFARSLFARLAEY